MKPPIPYFGSKATIASQIAALLPAHEHYVEPYCGSLAVLLAKPRSTLETVNDLDGNLMTFWRVLRDRPDELARVCALTPHSRAEYGHATDTLSIDHIDELERARCVWVALTQSRSASMNPTPPGWSYSIGRANDLERGERSRPRQIASMIQQLPAVAERIARVSLECRPALAIITEFGVRPQVLLYVDPPYLASTRLGSNRYRHEMPHEAEHRDLAETLHACRATVVLSGYPSPLYDDLYADWHHYEIRTRTANAARDRARTEVLWSNWPLARQEQLDLAISDGAS